MGLDKIRQEIDTVDKQMRELFLRRMELSGQVIEEKKKTGDTVYVPKREAEIIARRMEGVETEKALEYEMFLKQIMAVSRTYQYSCLKLPEDLAFLEGFQGEFEIQFTCGQKSHQLLNAVMALTMAGITIQSLRAENISMEKMICHISVRGDFDLQLERGAILQIYEENEHVSFQRNIP